MTRLRFGGTTPSLLPWARRKLERCSWRVYGAPAKRRVSRERTEAEKRYIRIAKAKVEQGDPEQDHPR